MFRRKGRNPFILELFPWIAYRISNGENTRVKHTDNIPCISLFHHMTVLCHHLLRLGKTHFLIALYMIHFPGCLKFSGADTHEGNTVSVVLIHICLNLKHKGGKLFFHWVNLTNVRFSWKRRRGHFQEMFQKGFHTKVGKSGTKAYWREFSLIYQFLVKLSAGSV